MTDSKVNIKIDGLEIKAEKGQTVLQAALEKDIYIPNLCYNPDLKPFGACRLCMVENDEGRLFTSCETLVEEGMSLLTESSQINRVRKMVAQLLIANHEWDCLTCAKDNNCKLQETAAYLGIEKEDLGDLRLNVKETPLDTSNPFFNRDLKKCILCGICVRVCSEIVGVSAVDFGFRGYDTRIIGPADRPILESSCVSCGECVVACPVGALVPKEILKPSREVKTICPYCGVGCGIYLGIRGNKIVNIRGDPDNPVNKGYLCVKGRFGHDFVNHPQRLNKPLIKQDGEFIEVEWDEAFDFIAENLSRYKVEPETDFEEFETDLEGHETDFKKYGKDVENKFAVIASAKCTNEENYLLQKFTRAVMGTNNIDHCARLCHAPSVAGLSQSIGNGAMTNSIKEIGYANCILAIGTNTTSTHPIIGLQIINAVGNGAKLIVANPREIDLSRHAQISLQHRPGTDVALLMGMMKVIVDEKLLNTEFIREYCENFQEFRDSLEEFHLDSVENITGVKKEKIIEAARVYASSNSASILYAMGITQHCHGTDNVLAVSNLALLTGNLGKYSAGVNSLRGQNNVQGSCDMGALPDVYPGYQKVDHQQISLKFQKSWDCKLSSSPGLTLPEIIDAALVGDITALYIMGENPVLSEPDSSQVKKALKNLEFLVVQDIFLTETAELADVVLPACSFAEKEGTFTNTERRVQKVRKALEPSGNSQPDWWIIGQIARKLGGAGFDFNRPEKIFQEMVSLTPVYGGMSYHRLDDCGLQWPCRSTDDPGTEFLHKDGFATDSGKARLMPLEYRPSAELADYEYPLILTTGRSLYQYHTGTMTRMVKGLNILHGHEVVEINPQDASDLGVVDGDGVRVISRRGEVKALAKSTETIPRGLVSMTFHFPETPTNLLTNPAVDSIANTPELKVCAVRVEKIGKNL
jgi:formate dehydrogenase (NADP+) alpha subunit